MTLLRRSILVLVLVCMGCSAQLAPLAPLPSDLIQKIERQVRVTYNIPESVKITVGPPRPSDFANYDAVTITMDGDQKKQTYEFLLSKDGKTLARMTKLDLTKDPYVEAMKKIDLNGRPTRGNKDAKVVVVNFDDFQCPFCSRMHQTLFPELLKEYGDRVQFVYKDYPLTEIHPWAVHAAVNANCLAAQSNDAYWDFADYIHANQHEVNSQKGRDAQFAALDRLTLEQGQKHNLDQTKLQACVKAQNEDAIKASMHEAEDVGVSATPTLFVNGQEMDGALPASEMRAAIDAALQRAGVPVPSHPPATAASDPKPPTK
ncbi:MAG TPA: thioredoxin domain-containing protein [Terriglobales bacterium]|nr:thioredoxin domain-containing protein [Terriglobales bacterium]